MGSLVFTFMILTLASSTTMSSTEAQGIKSSRLLDLLIRDYTFQSYSNSFGTGQLHTIHLPANLSGIIVSTVRYRCGSLRRYGATFNEFHLGTGYQLISPVLGLLAYNAGDDMNFSTPYEVVIQAKKEPITIDFSNTTRLVNVTTGHGHFGLVVQSPLLPFKKKAISRWKIAVGSSIGAAIGASLLGLLLIAMFVKVKKKARMDEIERRTYEEEALQVSMVGHVRAHVANGTRTVPTIEHGSRLPRPSSHV
ncbi:hypothetical protein POM88_030633 [Heracleum sosnowskyi]|uniref:Transmembrane protein n=1 Tax=Heracleum sosnowskyi TaxID=360622 RepID=A0AAD8HYW9_9APIA|nr:hypothetical protein POM88_030633 [Heracleum sosnowskyi]